MVKKHKCYNNGANFSIENKHFQCYIYGKKEKFYSNILALGLMNIFDFQSSARFWHLLIDKSVNFSEEARAML